MVIVHYKRREISGYNINGSSVESVRRENVLCGQCYFYAVIKESWSILIKSFGRKDFMNFFAPSREKQPLRKSIDLEEPVELSKSIQM